MVPFPISSLAKIVIGVVGTGAIIHWAAKEIRRMNDELARIRAATTVDPSVRRTFPTLRCDPHSGEWRVTGA